MVCVRVYVFATIVNPAETAEPIEMLLADQTRLRHSEEPCIRRRRTLTPLGRYDGSMLAAAAMHPVAAITVATFHACISLYIAGVYVLFKESALVKSTVYSWRRGVVVSGVRRMNELNARRARLVLGWATLFGRLYRLGM